MASVATERPAVRRDRPANPMWDRVFFSGMAVMLWATVLFGFARTYFMAGMVRAPLPNRLVHVHGVVFPLWMVLLVGQIGLIAGRKVRRHMTLGLAGFGLAAAMVVLGVLAATDALRRGSSVPGLDATFYVVPMLGITTFAVMVFLSYRWRFKAGAHKRLILIATICIAGAAIARWPVAILQEKPALQNLVTLTFLLLIAGYDLISLRRVHKTTLWAGLALMVVQLAEVPIGLSPAWLAFARMMGGKGQAAAWSARIVA
jgi:hypothetical protein